MNQAFVHESSICSRIKHLFTNQAFVHESSIYSWIKHLFMNQAFVHELNICSWIKHLFMNQAFVHESSICSRIKHLFTNQAFVHESSICSWVVCFKQINLCKTTLNQKCQMDALLTGWSNKLEHEIMALYQRLSNYIDEHLAEHFLIFLAKV